MGRITLPLIKFNKITDAYLTDYKVVVYKIRFKRTRILSLNSLI